MGDQSAPVARDFPCRTGPKGGSKGWKPLALSATELLDRMENFWNALDTPSGVHKHPAVVKYFDKYYKSGLFRDGFESSDANVTSGREREMIDTIQELLSEAIFHGALKKKNYNFRFIAKGTPAWKRNREGSRRSGTTFIRGLGQGTTSLSEPVPTVWLYESEITVGRLRMLSYIGTILHELVHALCDRYVCECETCFVHLHTGETGHGALWTRLASGVEKFAQDVLQIKDVSLGVSYSAFLELKARKPQPDLTEEFFGSWGLSREWESEIRADMEKEQKKKVAEETAKEETAKEETAKEETAKEETAEEEKLKAEKGSDLQPTKDKND